MPYPEILPYSFPRQRDRTIGNNLWIAPTGLSNEIADSVLDDLACCGRYGVASRDFSGQQIRLEGVFFRQRQRFLEQAHSGRAS
jgi:hypothetical protein